MLDAKINTRRTLLVDRKISYLRGARRCFEFFEKIRALLNKSSQIEKLLVLGGLASIPLLGFSLVPG